MNNVIKLTFEDMIMIMNQMTSMQNKYNLSDDELFDSEITITRIENRLELDVEIPKLTDKRFRGVML